MDHNLHLKLNVSVVYRRGKTQRIKETETKRLMPRRRRPAVADRRCSDVAIRSDRARNETQICCMCGRARREKGKIIAEKSDRF